MAHTGKIWPSSRLLLLGPMALFLGAGYNLMVGGPEPSFASTRVTRTGASDSHVARHEEDEGHGPELATYMGHLQRLAHKLNLSLNSKNSGLSAFYLHEVEEVLTQISEIFPTYDGFAVGEMLSAFAQPSLDPLEDAVTSEDWVRASQSYAHLVESCNECHRATGHGVIVITTTSLNPFNQSFER